MPIDSPTKCDHFIQKNLTPILNLSQDTRLQIFRKSGVNITKSFLPKLIFNYQQVVLAYFLSFTEFNI